MRKITNMLLLLVLCSFRGTDHEMDKCLVKDGETILFSNKPVMPGEKSNHSLRKGSYDGSSYDLYIDTAHRITLSKMLPSHGPKQDELLIAGCSGQLKRVAEYLVINFEKYRKHYYLVNLDSGSVSATFDKLISITLLAQGATQKSAEYFCHQKDQSGVQVSRTMDANGTFKEEQGYPGQARHNTITLTAVPPGMKKKELYAADHAPHTLAHFAQISVETGDGKRREFPRGNYILCEGDTLILK